MLFLECTRSQIDLKLNLVSPTETQMTVVYSISKCSLIRDIILVYKRKAFEVIDLIVKNAMHKSRRKINMKNLSKRLILE